MTTDKRWIKIPGAGQLRGEGEWIEVDKMALKKDAEQYYEWCKRTGYLPTVEQEEKPT
jgi:hypothetical protein